MNFSMFTALAVFLALAHGAERGSPVKRDLRGGASELDRLVDDTSASLASATQDAVQKVKGHIATTARAYVEDSRAKIPPLVEKVPGEAVECQERVKPFVANAEERMKPLADNFQAQVEPLAQLMENFFKRLMDQTEALLTPQQNDRLLGCSSTSSS
ncbi:type-4 ice-structuring protein LS-12-like [Phycodurus eques]|uniref:type-4 ice-structuring protein LS-12-like n=1 Tax=Phycodurus eques TaxID=693459 RepID=UPI002ACED7DE|nr:type-4 ice-structuring protein LS-12-like [Phycodurus eques]